MLLGAVDVDLANLADPTAADQFASLAAHGHRAGLRAVLEHAAVAFDRLAASQILRQADTQRLLDVDVLAGTCRRDGHGHVPVIRRGDADRVDVVAGEDLPEILIGATIGVLVVGVHDALGLLAAILPHVADGHQLGVGAGQLIADVHHPARPDAQVAKHHAVAGRRPPFAAQRVGGNHVRRRRGTHGQRGAFQELSPASAVSNRPRCSFHFSALWLRWMKFPFLFPTITSGIPSPFRSAAAT